MNPNQRRLRLRKTTLRDLGADDAARAIGGKRISPTQADRCGGGGTDTCTDVVPTCCDCTITVIITECQHTCPGHTC